MNQRRTLRNRCHCSFDFGESVATGGEESERVRQDPG